MNKKRSSRARSSSKKKSSRGKKSCETCKKIVKYNLRHENGKTNMSWFKKTYGKMPMQLETVLNQMFDNDGPTHKTPATAFGVMITELNGHKLSGHGGMNVLSGGGGPYHKRTWAIWVIIVSSAIVSLGCGAYFGVPAAADAISNTDVWKELAKKANTLMKASGVRITEELTAAAAEIELFISGRGQNVPKMDALSLYTWIALAKSIMGDSKKIATTLWSMVKSGGSSMISANTALLDAIEWAVVFDRNRDPNGAQAADANVNQKIADLISIMQQQGNQQGISALQSIQLNSTAGPSGTAPPNAPPGASRRTRRSQSNNNGPAAMPPSSPSPPQRGLVSSYGSNSPKTPPGTPPPLSPNMSSRHSRGKGVKKTRRHKTRSRRRYRRAQ